MTFEKPLPRTKVRYYKELERSSSLTKELNNIFNCRCILHYNCEEAQFSFYCNVSQLSQSTVIHPE